MKTILALMLAVLGACVVEEAPESSDANDDDAAADAEVADESGSGCSAHEDCAAGALCHFPDGSCGEHGMCVAADATFGGCDVAVCGCDGRDYPSACAAWDQGVSLSREGACTEPPTEPAGPPSCGGAVCAAGEFCLVAEGQCGAAEYNGTCTPTTTTCTSAAEPVCGCDGKTYPSRCAAIQAGVSPNHDGAC